MKDLCKIEDALLWFGLFVSDYKEPPPPCAYVAVEFDLQAAIARDGDAEFAAQLKFGLRTLTLGGKQGVVDKRLQDMRALSLKEISPHRLLSPKLPGLVPYLLKKESDDGAHHDFGGQEEVSPPRHRVRDAGP